jgi:hypothetical protein
MFSHFSLIAILFDREPINASTCRNVSSIGECGRMLSMWSMINRKLVMSHPELFQKFAKPGVQGSPCRGFWV